MPADLILKDNTIELVDAQLVSITDADGNALVRITGRLRVTDHVEAGEVHTGAVRVGTGASGESRPAGTLLVKDGEGADFFQVRSDTRTARCYIGDNARPGHLKVRGETSTLTCDGAVASHHVRAATLDTAELVVGQGAQDEPREAGMVRMKNDAGADTVEIDAGGTDIERPSIKVRWRQLADPRQRGSRIGNVRLGGGSGFRFRRGGRLFDMEEREPEEGVLEEVELDLVEDVLFLRKAIRDLTERVQQLEGDT